MALSVTPRSFIRSRTIASAWLVLLVALRAWDPVPIEILRLQLFDQYQRWQPRPMTRQPIVIVDIDEASLAAIGQWPWPRTLLADLVVKLFRAGAVAVGFDMVFAEPDRMSPPLYARSAPGLPTAVIEMLAGLPSNDDVLAEVFRQTRVVLGRSGTHETMRDGVDGDTLKVPVAELGVDPRPFLLAWPGLVHNLPELAGAAAGQGMFNLSPEKDGIVRRVPGIVRVGDKLYPNLILELLRVGTGQDTIILKANEAGVESVLVANAWIPTDRNGRIWVRFTGHDPARYVSAKDVISGNLVADAVAGKLVLVGTSAAGLLDIKSTPLNDTVPGVEVLAQLLETIVTQTYLFRPSYTFTLEMLVLSLVGGLLIVLVPVLGAVWTLGLFLGVSGGLAGASWYLFLQHGTLLDAAYPTLGAFSVYALLEFANYTREEAKRRQIRDAFVHYLSPELVEELVRDRSKLVLGGESRELTVLFCDIHGFTTISETCDAPAITRLLNRVFEPLSETIIKAHGTIDKYIGDTIMAFWNAPLEHPGHARTACLTALAMVRAMGPVNRALKIDAEEEGRPYAPVVVGIGLNTGQCCVGNMGSEHRFDYSAIGDDVNLASRLEGQTRVYRVPIIVGEKTYAEAADLAMLELDLITVKGKTVPARIYALLGDPDFARSEKFCQLREAHSLMLAAYRAQDWDAAGIALELCREHCQGLDLGRLYDTYEDRTATYRMRPPGPGWDGVIIARAK
jgi:adenylate cyclase